MSGKQDRNRRFGYGAWLREPVNHNAAVRRRKRLRAVLAARKKSRLRW